MKATRMKQMCLLGCPIGTTGDGAVVFVELSEGLD